MNRKRFIAGALCPKCQIEDRIVVYDHDNQNWIECMSCGYKQSEIEAGAKPAAKTPTEITVKWPIRKKTES